MDSSFLAALFGGTGIASVITVAYRIFKERRQNIHADMAGDLTLGEMFRASARREVAEADRENVRLRAVIVKLQDQVDAQAAEIRQLRSLVVSQER